MRRAKDSKTFKQIHKEVLEGSDVDTWPVCGCPLHRFPDKMSTYFCSMKCDAVCDNFRNFTFITDTCEDFDCSNDNPCLDCLDEIENFKFLIMQARAISTKWGNYRYIAKRLRNWINKDNEVYTAIRDAKRRKKNE